MIKLKYLVILIILFNFAEASAIPAYGVLKSKTPDKAYVNTTDIKTRNVTEVAGTGLSTKKYNPKNTPTLNRIHEPAKLEHSLQSDTIGLEDASNASRTSYIYLGSALTFIGMAMGLIFGRPALMLSVIGIVFFVIGILIHV